MNVDRKKSAATSRLIRFGNRNDARDYVTIRIEFVRLPLGNAIWWSALDLSFYDTPVGFIQKVPAIEQRLKARFASS